VVVGCEGVEIVLRRLAEIDERLPLLLVSSDSENSADRTLRMRARSVDEIVMLCSAASAVMRATL
jgi:hypothetical protein